MNRRDALLAMLSGATAAMTGAAPAFIKTPLTVELSTINAITAAVSIEELIRADLAKNCMAHIDADAIGNKS